MMLASRRVHAVFLAVLLILIMACSPTTPGQGGPPGEEPTQLPAGKTETPLESVEFGDVEWVLENYGPAGGEAEPLPGSTITLRFEGDQLAGTAGCNSYFGNYQSAGTSLRVGTLGSTEMWCEGLMDQESTYLALLAGVETAEQQGERLILSGPAGRLIFGPPAPVPDQPLVGTLWELRTLVTGDAAQSVVAGSRITIEFSADDRVGGSAGCNSFGSSFSLDGQQLSFGLFTTTLMACLEPGIMEQEALFLELLQGANSLAIVGEQLRIRSTAGELILQPAVHLSLVGTDWVLGGIVSGDAVVQSRIDERISARFEGKQVTGMAGCNRYSADYEIKEGTLILGPAGLTHKACEQEVMQRETEFLTALAQATSFDVRLETLSIYNSAGRLVLQFQAAP